MKHFPTGLDNRIRDQDGEIRNMRSDTLVITLRKEYVEQVAAGYSGCPGTVLKREGLDSLHELLEKAK